MSESPLKVVKLELESDQDFTFPLATNMVVNFDSEHFYIRFYQASPPTLLNGEAPESVKAKLVAGAVIPLSKMDGIIRALQENFDKRTGLQQEDFDTLDPSHNLVVTEDASVGNDLSVETLPEYLEEDEVDDFLVRNGIIDKLLSQLDQTPRSKDWEAELNEL